MKKQNLKSWEDQTVERLVANCDRGIFKCAVMQGLSDFRLFVDRLTEADVSNTLEWKRRISEHKIELESLKAEITKKSRESSND